MLAGNNWCDTVGFLPAFRPFPATKALFHVMFHMSGLCGLVVIATTMTLAKENLTAEAGVCSTAARMS